MRSRWGAAGAEGGPLPNSVVLMATPDLAGWISNQDFMSNFLGALNPKAPSEMDVLAGVVDGIPSQSGNLLEHFSGLSVMYGSDAEVSLPELWMGVMPREDPDAAAAVSFVCSSLHSQSQKGDGLEVTLPLANTVFQNGRRSTLFASRWS